MKAEIKQKWIERLNSGEIRQAKCNLAVGNARCCLGVLCDILEIPKDTESVLNIPLYNFDGYMEDVEIPRDYCENIIGMPYKFSLKLQELNDDGVPFPEIAKVIEAEVF